MSRDRVLRYSKRDDNVIKPDWALSKIQPSVDPPDVLDHLEMLLVKYNFVLKLMLAQQAEGSLSRSEMVAFSKQMAPVGQNLSQATRLLEDYMNLPPTAHKL